ncbi:MAG: anti-sigma factor family protein [Planctomycetota bacterium]|jgi:anti-sigma factor ChrR (cupin superfamily)
MTCPDENRLVEYIEGILMSPVASSVEAHLDTCPTCREILSDLIRACPVIFSKTGKNTQQKERRILDIRSQMITLTA